MSKKSIRIAIDCMGGDHGLSITVPAAKQFAQQHPDTLCLLVGDEAAIRAQLNQEGAASGDWYEIVHASETVCMDDPVEVALRRKKDSSMRSAAQRTDEGSVGSAGTSGA